MEGLVILLVLGIPLLAIIAIVVAGSASSRVRTVEATLKKRIARLEAALRVMEAERQPAGPPPEPVRAPRTRPALEPEPEPELASEPEPAEALVPETTPPPRAAEAAEAAPPTPAPKQRATPTAPRSTLEERIGGRWFNWIGILALLIGVSYLIKYAHEQGWISPWTQFGLGIGISLVLLVAGHIAHRQGRYVVLSRALWGGAIGILFLVMFAGYRIHGILSQPASYAGMVLATVLGAAIAIVYRARSAAVLAALGGYLTPLLLWSEPPGQLFLFVYLAILTAGLLFAGWWRAWWFLRPLAFLGTLAWFAAWWVLFGPTDPDRMVALVTLFFCLFSADVAAWTVGRRATFDPTAWAVLTAVCVAQLTVGLVLLLGRRPDAVGPFLGGTALWLGAGAWLVHRRRPDDVRLQRLFGCAAASFLLLVPPLDERFQPYGVSIGWAATAFVFLATTRRGSGAWGRAWAQAALLLAAARLLVVDTARYFVDVDPYRPFLTWRGLTYGLVILAYVLAWRVFAGAEAATATRPEPSDRRRLAGRWARSEHFVVTLFLLAATTLPLVLLSLELRDALAHYARPSFEDREEAWVKSTNYSMTLLWIVYLTLLLAVARLRGSLALVRLGLTLGAIVLWKLVAADIAHLYQPEHTPILNMRFLVLAVLAAGSFGTARVFRRAGPEATTVPIVSSVLLAVGHAAVQLAAALEWHDFAAARSPEGAWVGAGLLGLAALAALHGTGLVTAAARRVSGALLVPGLALLLMAAFEVVVLYVLGDEPVAPTLFLHLRFLVGVGVAAGLFVSARALRRLAAAHAEDVRAWGVDAWSAMLAVSGHLTLLATLGIEAVDLFRRHAGTWTPESPISVVHGAPLALVALAGAYGALLLLSGLRRDRAPARALALLLLAAGLVGLPAALFLGGYVVAQTALLNTRFLFGGVLALGLFAGGEAWHWRSRGTEARTWRTPLVLAGHATLLFLLTLEANDVFTLRGEDRAGGLSLVHARQLSFSVVWALYAIAMVVAGILRGYQPVRLMALVLLLGTIFKVFLFDLSFLENPYRILSFLALGLILVGVSYVYQRYKSVLFGDDEASEDGTAEA